MEVRIETIGPKRAAEILKRNWKGNRRIRRVVIKQYKADMLDGCWKLTHQPIAITKSGELIDGQHRLMAVVESGVSIPMLVAYGVEQETYDVVDQGSKRDIADALNIDRRIASAVGFLGSLAYGSGVSKPKLAKIYDAFSDELESILREGTGTDARIVSSAASKSALALNMKLWPEHYEYLLELYRDLVHADTMHLPPVGHFVVNRIIHYGGIRGGQNAMYWFFIMFHAFDPNKRNAKRIVFRNQSLKNTTGKARHLIKDVLASNEH